MITYQANPARKATAPQFLVRLSNPGVAAALDPRIVDGPQTLTVGTSVGAYPLYSESYPDDQKQLPHSCGLYSVTVWRTVCHDPSTVRTALARKTAFSLAKAFWMELKLGRRAGDKESGILHLLFMPYAFCLLCRQIIHEDDIVWCRG